MFSIYFNRKKSICSWKQYGWKNKETNIQYKDQIIINQIISSHFIKIRDILPENDTAGKDDEECGKFGQNINAHWQLCRILCLLEALLLRQDRSPPDFGEPDSTSSTYMQKAGDTGDISPPIFLDFSPNFRLKTRNQYCTQAIA